MKSRQSTSIAPMLYKFSPLLPTPPRD